MSMDIFKRIVHLKIKKAILKIHTQKVLKNVKKSRVKSLHLVIVNTGEDVRGRDRKTLKDLGQDLNKEMIKKGIAENRVQSLERFKFVNVNKS